MTTEPHMQHKGITGNLVILLYSIRHIQPALQANDYYVFRSLQNTLIGKILSNENRVQVFGENVSHHNLQNFCSNVVI